MKLGLLHPGAMGATIGAVLTSSGHQVYWLAGDRSEATAARAREAGLSQVSSLSELVEDAQGIISVCPPHAAGTTAEAVAAAGFRGPYLDANAVAPATARSMAGVIGDGFVDGGIVGPPARRVGTTRLYLSGPLATEVAAWFTDERLGVHLVEGPAGAASALKMCYAAYTKGTSALLLAIRALAEAEGVSESLVAEWELSQPDLPDRSRAAARGTAGKAWRFVGEMEEIAASFADQGLPGEFHLGAAAVYRRMSSLKEAVDPDLDQVLEILLHNDSSD